MSVPASVPAGIVDGLAGFLGRLWDCEVTIVDPQWAAAGARRSNLLFTAQRSATARSRATAQPGATAPVGNQSLDLVATIILNPAMQAMEVQVEAAILREAEAAGVPVAPVHAVCTDPTVVGGPFFVTERVDGETIPRRVLRLIDEDPALGRRLARQCGEALARLHAVDPADAPLEVPRPENCSATEWSLARLDEAMDTLLQPSPAFRLGLRWLQRHLPGADRTAFLHGDFRTGNLIIGPDGLRAALDWEGSRLGDPMEDLAWICVRMWRFRNDDREVGGFADRRHLRTGYEAAGGRWNDEGFHWWKVALTLKWGLGLAGQAAAHLDGSVPSIVMAASGRRVAELEYDVLMLIRPAEAETDRR